MAQSKVNSELASLGVSFTDIDKHKRYATQSKLKVNSPLHRVGENNLLPSETMNSNQNEEAVTAAAAMMNLLLPSNNNSTNSNFSQKYEMLLPLQIKLFLRLLQ